MMANLTAKVWIQDLCSILLSKATEVRVLTGRYCRAAHLSQILFLNAESINTNLFRVIFT